MFKLSYLMVFLEIMFIEVLVFINIFIGILFIKIVIKRYDWIEFIFKLGYFNFLFLRFLLVCFNVVGFLVLRLVFNSFFGLEY